MKKLTALLFLIIFSFGFFPNEASAQLYGFITEDTILDEAGSPYLVIGDIFVQPEVTLTIKPGVTLVFQANTDTLHGGDYFYRSELIIQGNLIANGRAGKPIVFTSTDSVPGDWGEIRFESVYACSLNYCDIQYADNGARGVHGVFNSFVSNCQNHGIIDFKIIEDSIIMENGNRGLTTTLEKVVIRGSVVMYNFEFGIVTYSDTVVIVDNSIHNNGDGIYCQGGSRIIQDNFVFSNDENGIHVFQGNGEDLIDNNKIIENAIGIYLQSGSFTSVISNNLICTNSINGIEGLQEVNGVIDIKIRNNLISNNGSKGCYFQRNGDNLRTFFISTEYSTISYNGFLGVELNASPVSVDTVLNCIITNNNYGLAGTNGQIISNYNDVWNNSNANYSGVNPGENDISVNPFFIDPNIENYQLEENSQCLFMGEDGSQMGFYGPGVSPGLRIREVSSDRFLPLRGDTVTVSVEWEYINTNGNPFNFNVFSALGSLEFGIWPLIQKHTQIDFYPGIYTEEYEFVIPENAPIGAIGNIAGVLSPHAPFQEYGVSKLGNIFIVNQ